MDHPSQVTQSDEIIITGASGWGYRYFFSRHTYQRDSILEALIKTSSTSYQHLMVGFKRDNETYHYNQMTYAIYFASGSIYIYEDGSNRGHKAYYTRGLEYEVRIELKSDTGAIYYYRENGTSEWVLLYDSAYSTLSSFRVGADVHSASFSLDNLKVTGHAYGSTPTISIYGDQTISLTVEDYAGQTATAATSISLVGEELPVANSGGPYTFDEAFANCHIWTVSFDGSSSTDDHGICTYVWDFGDGGTGTGVSPTHQYSTTGTYTLTLTVTDHAGQTHSDSTTVTIDLNDPPVADPGGPYTFDEGGASGGQWNASVNGSSSTDDHGICTYVWDFGDGGTGTGVSPTHQYSATGTYTLTLTVTDHAGQTHTSTTTLTILDNEDPVPSIAAPATVGEENASLGCWSVDFDAGGSTDDFGIWRYEWDFGDGSTGTGQSITHSYCAGGTYTVTLTVYDHAGQSVSTTTTIQVQPGGLPVADAGGPYGPIESGQPVTFDGTGSTDDFGITEYFWDFGEFIHTFDGTQINYAQWAAPPQVIQDNEIILTGAGSWGTRYFFSRNPYHRDSVLEAVIKTPTASTQHFMVGFKRDNPTCHYNQMPYAIYFYNGYVYIYEDGSSRGHRAYYTRGLEYEVRIELKKDAGAFYYLRERGATDWTLIYNSSYGNLNSLRIGVDVHTGSFVVDDIKLISHAYDPTPTVPIFQDQTVILTVTDNASQTDSDTPDIDIVIGAPPQAEIVAPDHLDLGIEGTFNASLSSDDYGIAAYSWDFGDGSSAEGKIAYHFYSSAGTYTVTLKVYDYAGQFDIATKTIEVSGENLVVCVPWQIVGGVEIPHDTWSGKEAVLKAVAKSATVPIQYTWDFGDGTSESGTITTASGRFAIEARHIYSGSDGEPFVANITITDATGITASDTYRLIIRPKTLEIEENVAIDNGLWWLYKNQIRGTWPAGTYGDAPVEYSYWSSYLSYYASPTASVVQAFLINGHMETGDPIEDPYVETVRRGMRYVFTRLNHVNIGPQTYGDPDTNGNGIGLQVSESYPIYQGGMVMDAIAATGTPDALAQTGGTNVRGRTYRDILTDMVDMYAWGQDDNSSGGGWRYSWNQWPDNSAAQWGAIGLLAAEEIFGITIPQWVKARNNVWLNTSYSGTGFGYTGRGTGVATTPSGMIQLAFCDRTTSDGRWQTAENWIANNWTWWRNQNNVYAYYAFTKSMRQAQPQEVVTLSATGLDWFGDETNGLARHLINRQQTDLGWPDYYGRVFSSAWTIIILTRTLFVKPPVAIIHASPNPGAVGQEIRFDASASYHLDPFKSITGYQWDFDVSDGLDWENPDATGLITTHTYGALGDYTVTLRVLDDNVPVRMDTDIVIISITIPPHPPSAEADGPYIAATGESITLDGRGSYDIDESEGDNITAYGWEIDMIAPRDFDDVTGVSPTFSGYDTAGTYPIGLRVTDDTENVFPLSGSPNLTDDDFTEVIVYNRCITDLYVRPKGTKASLVWTHIGADEYKIYRSEKGPNTGMELIGTTSSTYSTFIDYNVELYKDYWYRVQVEGDNQICGSYAYHINSQGRIRNRPPEITSTPELIAQETQLYSYEVDAVDPDGHAITYLLDQAPGGMSIDSTTGLIEWTPAFSQVGANDVTVRVMDAPGASSTQFFIIVVSPRPNEPPLSDPGGLYSGLRDREITFDGSGSYDPEGDLPLSYQWNFGDGITSTEENPTHVYTASGLYIVTLYVTDSRDATGSAETTAQIDEPNRPPTAVISGLDTGHAQAEITFDASDSDDPDEDTLSYTWDFGDSTPSVTGITVTHIYEIEGTYNVSLTVDDGRGGIDTDSMDVVISPPNEPPDAQFTGNNFGNVGDEFTFDASSTTDPDGHIISYGWDFGDGSTTTGQIVTHVFDTPGHYTVSLTVSDDDDATDTATLAVHINAPPEIISTPETTALEDSLYTYDIDATDEDGDTLTYSLTEAPSGMSIDSATGVIQWTPIQAQLGDNPVTVLVNDNNGRTTTQSFVIVVQNVNDAPQITSSPVATATEDTPYTYDVVGTDEDGDTLTYALTEAPSGMSIDSATGLIQWTPTQAQIGDNSITVMVVDGNGGEDSQSFTITVVNLNDPPTIISTAPLTALEDSPYSYDVEATDEDGDTLTFALSSAPNGMTIDEVSGLIQWQPVQVDVGNHLVTVTVNDGHGGTDTQSYTLAVENVNDSPQITSTPLTGAVRDFLYTYDVEASDEDEDTLAYTLTTSPNGMSIESSTGLIQWTPDQTQIGPHPVEILVTDGQGGLATQSYTLTVSATNSAPQITSTPVTTATQDQPYTYDVEATDPDNDPITFSLDTAPSSMSIAPDTGLIQWTPGSTQTGANQVVVAASDNKGATTTQAFTIDVQNINDPPEITSTPVTIAGVNVLYTYDVEASDIDGDIVLYSLDVSPTTMTIDSDTGLIQWTPAEPDLGDHTILVRARDFYGAFDTQEYTLTVQQIIDNTPPRVRNIIIDPLILNPGETATITIDAVDNEDIGSYELQVDGVDIPLVGNTATYTATTIGVHEIQAIVCDTSGNCDSLIAKFGVRDPGDTTSPEVSITSPAADSELTAPTDLIGTASDENLVSYTLEYSEKDKNNFIQFYKGHTEVLNDVLGSLDPSLLINGLYDIRLSAVDVNGLTNSVMMTYRITGDLKVGNFTVTFKDLEIPVAGIPITIYRTYDSRIRHNMGDFGYGWNIDIRTTKVEENREPGEGWYSQSSGGFLPTYYLLPDGEHYVSITLPDGRVMEFDCKFTPESQFLIPITWLNSAVYSPRPGTNGSLVALDDSPMYFDGSHVLNWDFDVYDPDRYQLTTIDGTIYIIDQNGGLEKVTDNNGNSLDITPGGILHSAGKSVTFTRDAQGSITEITDPMGNVITYDYDVNGDLIAVTDQEENTSQYTYNSNHGLTDIFDPTGNRPVRNEYDYDGRLIAHIDAEGNRIEYTHDPDSRQEIVSDRLGNITVFEYDDNGNVTKKTDPLGNETAYAYDERGNKLSETDPLGNTTTYTYDTLDNMLTKTDPLNNTTSYTYNARGQVLTTTDPLGYVTTNTYDSNGNLLTTTDPLGNVTTNTYDARGNLTSTTDPLGNVTNYTYDSFGNMLTQTDPLGNITTYTYDNNGNQLTQTYTRTTLAGPETITTTNVYDSLNRLVETIDPYGNSTITQYNPIGKQSATIDKNGNRTEYEYDSRGNLIRTTYPDNTTETATYDAEGRKRSSADRSGRTTQYVYDVSGRLTQTIYPDGSSTTTTYDAAGMVVAQTDERGNTTTYTYDAAGRRISVTDPLDHTTTYTYDANGNQLSMTDANGNTYTYVYDSNNRRIITVFPNGSFTSITYDNLGHKTAETDQAGITTQFEYDELGRLIKVTDALGQETTYTYDEIGNKISQTDANGNTTTWEYDKLGRVTKRTLPLSMSETMAYDAAGNLISKTDFNGDTITYTYDDNNRLITKTYPDTSSISFAYTPTGQRSSILDSRGLTNFVYDERDRLIQRTDPDGTVISYAYDAAGNRTSVTVPSGTTTYAFDTLNRLATVTDPDGGVTDYTYDTVGNRASVTYPNSTSVVYTYDTLNRLIRLENRRSDNSIISSYAYTLGPSGNRIRVEENTGRVVDFTYDALYRLTEESITEPTLDDHLITYSYDPVGNRLSKGDTVEGPTNYTYDENDRLLAENGTSYTYDNNGNTIRKTEGSDVTIYSYDYENQLVQVQTPTSLMNYTYDADGIRVSSSVDGVVTDYIVDKNRDYAQVLEERDSGSGLIVSYVYGDDLISMDRDGVISFYHYDGNGNTRQLTDFLENITDRYIYDAFGIMLNQTGITVNNYLYKGEQYDANVGFYYLRARYYNSFIGRFLTFDTYQGKQFDPISLHKYLYANGDPINNIDPTGKFTLIQTLTVVTITTILANIAISLWAFHTVAKCNFKIDGILLSARFDVSHIVAGGGGIDILFDLKSSKFFVSIAAELGLDPLSTFKKHRGGGFTAIAGLIFGLSNPNQLSGFGVSAFWPTSVLRLMPIIGGTSNVWGAMTQFAKNVIHHKGATVGFGRSFSGPAIMFFGTSYRSFSSMLSWNTNFIEVEEIVPTIKGYIDQLKGIASALASLGRDMSSFAKNADRALSLLP